MTKGQTIAIDGPAGAGKSTVARELARRLGYLYVDTGAMYRALTVKALQDRVDLESETDLEQLAARAEVDLRPGTGEDGRARIFLDGVEVSAAIRSPEVNRAVSYVARSPAVRRRLLELQRQLAAAGQVVVEGRDIASYVLPDATHKFFLTASPEVRAKRRWAELAAAGYRVLLAEVRADLAERDRIDSQREMAPLVQVPEAVVVDSSCLTIEEVVHTMLLHVTGE
jgi:cytidylate kinase